MTQLGMIDSVDKSEVKALVKNHVKLKSSARLGMEFGQVLGQMKHASIKKGDEYSASIGGLTVIHDGAGEEARRRAAVPRQRRRRRRAAAVLPPLHAELMVPVMMNPVVTLAVAVLRQRDLGGAAAVVVSVLHRRRRPLRGGR